MIIALFTFNLGFSQDNSYQRKIALINEVKAFPTLASEAANLEEISDMDAMNLLNSASPKTVLIAKSENAKERSQSVRRKRSKKSVRHTPTYQLIAETTKL